MLIHVLSTRIPLTPDLQDMVVLVHELEVEYPEQDRSPERVNLYEIMTKPALGVDPNMGIRYCARLFFRFGLSAAPVIENDEVIGVVTYNEMVLRGLLASGD